VLCATEADEVAEWTAATPAAIANPDEPAAPALDNQDDQQGEGGADEDLDAHGSVHSRYAPSTLSFRPGSSRPSQRNLPMRGKAQKLLARRLTRPALIINSHQFRGVQEMTANTRQASSTTSLHGTRP
jgi:hypothetical protein